MDYRPDIDGLRAVAVAAVVAVHVLPTALPGGYVGVDIFFVISGFLITAISLHRIEAGRFSFQDFYARRARRLLPALFVLLSGTGLVGSLLYDGATLADLGASTAAAVLFVANIHDYGTVDYFTAPAETRPLLHLWSLGVEEQFYLLAPWLLVGLARRPRALAAATVAMVLGSLGLGIAVLELDPPAAFYLLPCRAWEVGLGMLLALAPKGWRAPRGSGLLGLLLIGIAVVGFDEHTPFPGLAAVVPCVGSALVIAAPRGGVSARLLSAPGLRWLGQRSYSLYLWHWPVLAFAMFWTMRAPTVAEAVGLVLLSVGLSELSHRFVETPLRRKRADSSDRRTLAWSAGGILATVVLALSWVGVGQESVTPRTDDRPLGQQLSALSEDCGAISRGEAWLRTCGFGQPGTSPDVVLWGDSHAAMLAEVVAETAETHGVSGVVVAKNSCPPALGVDKGEMPALHRCGRHNDAVLAWIRQVKPRRVLLFARWALAVEGSRYGDRSLAAPRLQQAGSQDRSVDFGRPLERTLRALTAQGTEVVVLGPTPEAPLHVANAVERATRLGLAMPDDLSVTDRLARQGRTEALLEELATRHGAGWLPLAPALCTVEVCPLQIDGKPLYSDDNHLSPLGAHRLVNTLGQALQAPLPLADRAPGPPSADRPPKPHAQPSGR